MCVINGRDRDLRCGAAFVFQSMLRLISYLGWLTHFLVRSFSSSWTMFGRVFYLCLAEFDHRDNYLVPSLYWREPSAANHSVLLKHQMSIYKGFYISINFLSGGSLREGVKKSFTRADNIFNSFKIFMKPSLNKTDLYSISTFTTSRWLLQYS